MFERLTPDEQFRSIYEIDFSRLRERGKRGIIFDLDNTLGVWGVKRLDARAHQLLDRLKRDGFKVGILSNGHEASRRDLKATLDGYIVLFDARKPRRSAYEQILSQMGLKPEEAVMVGDQIITDIYGAKRAGLYTIQVSPIDPSREFLFTQFNRLLERVIALLRSYVLFLGFRYFKRRRRQIWLSIAGVAVGVIVLNVTLAILDGFDNYLLGRITAYNPHIVISSRWFEDIANWEQVIDQVRGVKGVTAVAPLAFGEAILQGGGSVTGVQVWGMTQSFDEVVHIEGMKDLTSDGILVGAEVADLLGLSPGDPVFLTSHLALEQRFTVARIFDTGIYQYDLTWTFIPLEQANELFGVGVNHIGVRVAQPMRVEEITTAIDAEVSSGFRVRNWQSANRPYLQALLLQRRVSSLLVLLILVVAGFGIANALMMMVGDKTREIGILRALGASKRAIQRLFVLEGLLIGIVGMLLGTAIGTTLIKLIQLYPIPLPGRAYDVTSVPVEIHISNFLLTALFAIIVSLVAAYFPARKAAGLDPVEAIRYE